MKRISAHFGMVALFCFSFIVFLYWSFPYGVLKEALSSQIQVATGMNVRMADLGPAFPLGFNANDVEISGGGDAKVAFKSVSVRLSIWQLFLMRVGINVDIHSGNKGELEFSAAYGLFSLLSGNVSLPSRISLTAEAFPLDGIVSYVLKQAVASGVGGPVAGPILSALGFRGSLNGTALINLDSTSMSQSTGDVKLVFKDSALLLNDPSIGLPDQIFKTAQITASMLNGTLKIDPNSKFASDELMIGLDGKIGIKNVMAQSDLDLKLAVKLSGGLGDKFGWVMDGLSGGASKGGNLNLQLRGTIGAPVPTPM